MSHSVSFGRVAKRKNSTLQGGTSAAFNVLFKNPTSLDRPTFTLNASDFDYNYARMGNRYYFVDDITYRNNDIVEVSCGLDTLATYKSEILASTQYVSYSNVSGGLWLPDTRIPIMRNAITNRASVSVDALSTTGSYILSVVGKTGVDVFRVSRSTIQSIIADLQDWRDNLAANLKSTFDFTDELTAMQSLANAITDTGAVGNAYDVAVQCIRSCIWVPFSSVIVGGTETEIYLGNYPTGLTGYKISTNYHSGNISVSIPWHYSDWRRTYCESIYLYLPFVGLINVNVDDISTASSLSIKFSVTASDGRIVYQVGAGSQIIGTYGGDCSMQIPIGINQLSSAGELVTTLGNGINKMVSSGISGAGGLASGNVVGAVQGFTSLGMAGVSTSYEVANVMLSTHLSCIGGIGGGAGAGLDLTAHCISVSRPTVCEPSAMSATMGVPTMKPLKLSSCSGFCQCANAHVSLPAEGWVMDTVDSYLNNGFYIE